MKRVQFVSVALLLLASGAAPSDDRSAFDSTLSGFARAKKLTVYHVSDLLVTQAPLTPDQMRTFYGVRTFEFATPKEIVAATNAVKRSSPASAGTSGDPRWLLDFTNDSDEVGTVTCDSVGRRGAVGSEAVAYANDALIDWLHSLSG